MRRVVLAVLVTVFALCSMAQDSQTVFTFLRLPVSAHVAALGGDNITIGDDDPMLVFHNPALINHGADNQLSLGMMTYMQGALTASAAWQRYWGDHGTWGLQGRLVNYGEMKETNVVGQQIGTFTAKDFALGATCAYDLSLTVTGGITVRMATSYIGSYSSVAACADLGLTYYNDESQWTFSAVARNLGGQLSAYEEDFERLPIDVQLGATKRLVGSPLRFSATLVRLNDWQHGFGRHLVIGADLILSEQFYLAAGYNAMRASEMKITNSEGASSHGAALSFGAGMHLERLQLHVAYAKLHVSSPSLLINFSYTL
ncbi:MAG: type IX secretion system protein PorQ [Prevotella sp.]|nr:type IX secretion system protein PorQ [Prevotella sp.]